MLSHRPTARWGNVLWRGPMADLAYALLAIVGFALLVLVMRGLDSL